MKNQSSSSPIETRPWWKEPYVWMVIGGPLSAVIACGITAIFILRGPDAVVPELQYPEGRLIKEKVEAATPSLQPAKMGRNHSATGGRQP
jgi:uncharacterized protein